MAYDACGTTRLDGKEILNRLAEYLDVDKDDLKAGLLALAAELKVYRELKSKSHLGVQEHENLSAKLAGLNP